ncbi:MAG: hypothetical protein ACOYMB_04615 [Patescibacteria group bacterium]
MSNNIIDGDAAGETFLRPGCVCYPCGGWYGDHPELGSFVPEKHLKLGQWDWDWTKWSQKIELYPITKMISGVDLIKLEESEISLNINFAAHFLKFTHQIPRAWGKFSLVFSGTIVHNPLFTDRGFQDRQVFIMYFDSLSCPKDWEGRWVDLGRCVFSNTWKNVIPRVRVL